MDDWLLAAGCWRAPLAASSSPWVRFSSQDGDGFCFCFCDAPMRSQQSADMFAQICCVKEILTGHKNHHRDAGGALCRILLRRINHVYSNLTIHKMHNLLQCTERCRSQQHPRPDRTRRHPQKPHFSITLAQPGHHLSLPPPRLASI